MLLQALKDSSLLNEDAVLLHLVHHILQLVPLNQMVVVQYQPHLFFNYAARIEDEERAV